MISKLGFLTASWCFLLISASFGAISSVTVTPASPATLSNGKAYYLAGVPYTFRVRATDPAATGKTYWNQITLRIIEDAAVRESCVINIDDNSVAGQTGLVVDNVADNTAVYTNIDFNISVRFRWDCLYFNSNPLNDVEAYVTEDLGSSGTDTNSFNFGVCSQVQILNFTQSGDASDAMVNPWHEAFNVTGRVVYYVAGESITNRVESIDAGETGAAGLYFDGAPSGIGDTDAGVDVLYAVQADFLFDNAGGDPGSLGNHAWDVRVAMNTAGGPEQSANTLDLNCDKAEVTAISFYDGGGINSPYYRSVNVTGTRLLLTAALENGGGSVVGNTVFVISDGTNTFNVQVNDGQPSGNALVTVPAAAQVPDGDTQPITYEVIRVYGGAYDGDIALNVGQYQASSIVQPANPVIYWDRNDTPGAGPLGGYHEGFTSYIGRSQTAYSITIYWTPLTAGAPDYDADFSSYRFYLRQSGQTLWQIVDKTSSGYAGLGDINTGSITISNLLSLTNYDYFLSAVDVFGNEVDFDDDPAVPGIEPRAGTNAVYEGTQLAGTPGPPYYGVVNTDASTIEVNITDGIDHYNDNSFAGDINPSARPFRQTAINVRFYMVSAGAQPASVFIVAADNSAGDLVTGGVITGSLVENTDYYRIQCFKKAANTWEGVIPETLPLIKTGRDVKFIVEVNTGGATSYSDHNSEGESPPGFPNDYEWTFTISKVVNFKPWPVRILNNVITDRDPVAYPSYYLTDDARVTLMVYDIKGRPVATILDNALRKGGQNIKEDGWRGTNKARRKLGVGLYYMHFSAKRVSDGKIILNEFMKVVMAR